MIQLPLQERWKFPLILLAVMFVAYYLQITSLSFYWDDWQAVFLAKINQPQLYWEYFSYDRPFSAWTYILTVPLLGTNPLSWHLFTLAVRWLGILAFCQGLCGLWPERRWQIRWAGLLLGVFPGFRQQWVAAAYSQHFITFALFSASLALMIESLRRPSRFWLFMPLAVIADLAQLMTMEYFSGLDLLRPALIFLLLKEKISNPLKRLAKTALHWLPYLLPLAVFVAWRLFFFSRNRAIPEDYLTPFWQQMLAAPFPYLNRLLTTAIQELLHVTIFSWLEPISPDTILLQSRLFYFAWGVGLALAAAIAWLMHRDAAQGPASEPAKNPFHLQASLLGLLAVFLGGIPIWGTNRQSTLGMWSDRFTLPLMLGGTLLLVTWVDWLVTARGRKAIFLAFLLGISAVSHIRTANRYRLDWVNQRNYYWQLNWRAPALKPGTAILSPDLPVTFESDYALGFALNLIYAPEVDSARVPYWWIYANPARSPLIPVFDEGQPIIADDFRNIRFEGSTSSSIMFVRNFDGDCVIALSPVYRGLPRLAASPEMFNVSHESQIETDPQKATPPPANIFGPEPERGWCYTFEKADLARQQGDWQAVVSLGEEASQKRLKPANGAELVPFILGFAHQEKWEQARQYTMEMRRIHNQRYAQDPVEPYLCNLWEQIGQETKDSTVKESLMGDLKAELNCNALLSP